MRTLDQIEPRRPLGDVFTPGDGNYAFVISQPGSYYLPARIAISTPNGIHITAAGVTLDLEGFDIGRQAGTGGDAITIDPAAHQCTVKNGTITGAFDMGVDGFANGASIRQLTVTGTTFYGINIAAASVITDCILRNNGGGGIAATNTFLITNCIAYDNGNTGFFTTVNGTLQNCAAYSNSSGIIAGSFSTLINCNAYSNTNDGLTAGNGSTLNNCTSANNGGFYGLSTGDGSTLIGCSSRSNTVADGINAGKGSSLLNCSSKSNTSADTTSAGIRTLEKCTLVNCTVTETANTNATASGTTGMGIRTGEASTVKDCTVGNNKGDGIVVETGSTVTGCTVRENGFDGIQAPNDSVITRNNCTANGNGSGVTDGAGIHTTLPGNRIEENQLILNDYGIKVDSIHSLIIRNTARVNSTANYQIAVSNRYGPILNITAAGAAAVSGSSAADTTATTHPWANFSY